MTPRQLEEALDANLVLQEAAFTAREGFEKLYYASVLRGQADKAQEYRELAMAAQEEIFDLQSISFDLTLQMKGRT